MKFLFFNLSVRKILFLVFLLILFHKITRHKTPAGAGSEWYVSSSQGDDSNDGASSEKPWKTLAKVSEQTLGPGAVIYLKRGDTWNEALIPKGNGNFNAQKWITVKPYGPENSPKPAIDRANASDANKDWAIKLVDNQAWRFEDLIVRNSKTGFVYLGTNEAVKKNGLIIERCEFYNIEGLPNHAKTPEEDQRAYWAMRGSSAIHISGFGYCKDGLPATNENCLGEKGYYVGSYGPGLSHVRIADVKIKRTSGYGIWIWAGGFIGGKGENYHVRNASIEEAGIGGFEISFVKNALIENLQIKNAGQISSWSGTFGVDINYTQNVAFAGGEITGTGGKVFTAGEGTGFNLNGPNVAYIVGMKIYENGGPAFATQGNPQPEPTKVGIYDNIIYGNAWLSDDPKHGQEYPEFAIFFNPGNLETAVTARNNYIQMKPGKRHLICPVKDGQTELWKDDLNAQDYRLPSNFFCGNKDLLSNNLIAGNVECGQVAQAGSAAKPSEVIKPLTEIVNKIDLKSGN